MSLLQVEDLSIQFHTCGRTVRAVEKLSFSVEEGEIVGLSGESGSGKTTAMLAVTGLSPRQAQVTGGKIYFQGKDITPPKHASDRRGAYERMMQTIRGCGLSMIFQNPAVYLDDMMTVGRQITETIRSHEKCTRKEAGNRAVEMLDEMGIPFPERRMKQYPFELSGGMCQRAALAVALACRPQLLIADEPMTALDPTVQRQILELLQRISRERGMAVLLASHDPGVTASICQRVVVMRAGKQIEEAMEDTGEQKWISGRERSSDTILSLQKVGWSYGVHEAVHDVSLEIGRGESFGLIGESGCGKTTVAKLIAGLIGPGSGKIQYKGRDILPPGKWRGRTSKIQMVFQDPAAALNPALTAGEMLEEALLAAKLVKGGACTEEIRKALERVGLSQSDAEKYPHEFSGGQKQRLVLARALIVKPEFLICDEPVASLDVTAKKQIIELLAKIQKEEKLSMLFISHDLGAVRHICQRIAVMYQGRIVEMGTAAEVSSSPCHPYTKLLLESELLKDPTGEERERYR